MKDLGRWALGWRRSVGKSADAADTECPRHGAVEHAVIEI